jgi:hypothetical protein
MINAKVVNMSFSGASCCNPTCSHNTKYHDHILGNVYYLKYNTPCLFIEMSGTFEYYCKDCVDIVYQNLKPALDSKLWLFS